MKIDLMSVVNGSSIRVVSGLFVLLSVFMVATAGAYGNSNSGGSAPHAGAIPHTAVVQETMNSGGYTYVQVKEDNRVYWIAATETALAKGETISFYEQMMMEQFTSKTLQRTFDRILFVSAIEKGDTLPRVASAVPNKAAPTPVLSNAPVRELGEAESQASIADIYTRAAELAGKTIELKGKVVKVSHGIMDRNWVHVQDQSGDGSKIVFRTIQEGVLVGDDVVAKGVLEVNKDFGFNYFYPVIVEDSVFTK